MKGESTLKRYQMKSMRLLRVFGRSFPSNARKSQYLNTQGRWGFCGKFLWRGFPPDGSQCFAAGLKAPQKNLPQNAPSSLCVKAETGYRFAT